MVTHIIYLTIIFLLVVAAFCKKPVMIEPEGSEIVKRLREWILRLQSELADANSVIEELKQTIAYRELQETQRRRSELRRDQASSSKFWEKWVKIKLEGYAHRFLLELSNLKPHEITEESFKWIVLGYSPDLKECLKHYSPELKELIEELELRAEGKYVEVRSKTSS